MDYLRPYDVANQKGARQGTYKYKPGTTGALNDSTLESILDVFILDSL